MKVVNVEDGTYQIHSTHLVNDEMSPMRFDAMRLFTVGVDGFHGLLFHLHQRVVAELSNDQIRSVHA